MTFQLSATASQEIRRRLKSSGRADPVASLAGSSETVAADDVLRQALRTDQPDEELRSHVERLLHANLGAPRMYPTVHICERSECDVADVREIYGIPFVIERWLEPRLDGISLDYVQSDEFVLRASDGSAVDLVSLLER